LNFRSIHRWLVLALALGVLPLPAAASKDRVIRYQLVGGSYLIDDCQVCGRPTLMWPMTGSFDLVFLEDGPLFTTYEVTNLQFLAGSGFWEHHVKGSGTYAIGGEFALQQFMRLQLDISDGFTNKPAFFTNQHTAFDRPWPMINVTLTQTNGTLLQTYHLNICAAPLRDLWFSTATGFDSGKAQSPTNHISHGDLLSFHGRVVKRQHELTARLGIMPIVPDVGLDAVDVAPGGELLFSITQKIFSERIGTLQHGDLLSIQGKIVKSNQQLLAGFGLGSTNIDAGLDAVQVLNDGVILFSISTNLAASSGRRISGGDILSDRGEIFRLFAHLMARFHPAQTNLDFGLDALFVWPHGEIWFSTEKDFQDTMLGPVRAGDLLSDQGYRVFSNRELVAGFAPLTDAADYGLDALFIVTDCRPAVARPRLQDWTSFANRRVLRWSGSGQVFQLERADTPWGPYVPCSPIIPETAFEDALDQAGMSFYRVRQW